MTAKKDLTSTEAATAFNTMRNGATTSVVSSITNGSRSDAVSGRATVEISNVTFPTDVGIYKLTSLGSVLTLTKYVDNVATTSSSIQIITSGSSNSGANPPTVLFQSALNGQTDLSFGSLGSFRVNTVLAATSAETATEIASKILNAVDSAGQVTANAWVSVPDADWANTAKANLGGTDSYKVVITTTGNTSIRIGTTSSLTAVAGYTVSGYIGLDGYNATLNANGVSEMAFTGTAANLSTALKTLEAKSTDGLGKVSVHIVPSDISVRVDSVTGGISYYKRVALPANPLPADPYSWTYADPAAKSAANEIATPNGNLTGYLTNITSALEDNFLESKGLLNSNSAYIGGDDRTTEGRFIFSNGPEAGLEFFISHTTATSKNGISNFSKVNATADTLITAGSSTQAEIRTWNLTGKSVNSLGGADITVGSAIVLKAGRTIGFKVKDSGSIVDTVYYTNTSSSNQPISTVLANLKTYFDANSNISSTVAGEYSIVGTKNTSTSENLGLFSKFNFTYTVNADSSNVSFTFSGKTLEAITNSLAASFQIEGINLYSSWNAPTEPNDNNFAEDVIAATYLWNDVRSGLGVNGGVRAYIVEYNAAANSTLLRRELSIPAPGVVTISTDPEVTTAQNNATFSGTVSGYTTSLNGSQLTFTSTQSLTNVTPNINYSFTPASGSPTLFTAPVITEGGNYALATALLEFPAGGLQTGDSITVSGLTFTASRATSATEVATAFASLVNNTTTGSGTSYGTYLGSLAGFTSGSLVSTNRILFTQVDSGAANSITSTAVVTTTSSNASGAVIVNGAGLTVNKFTTAQDATFTVDDKSHTKTTNTVGDVISGLTLQLTGGAGIANVSVALGEDKSEVSIKSFMTAYNDLVKATNTMNANSANSEKPGTFANSPTSLSFISDIKRKVADGATYNIGKTDSTGRPYTMSLSSLGLDYQRDGTLLYNAASLASAKSQGLRDKLLSGLRIGYSSSTDNLADLLKSQMSSIGVLTNQTSSGAESLSSLSKEKDRLEERLNKIQAGYIAQYSNLNKLLFQLNSTSQSLTSALDGLKNA